MQQTIKNEAKNHFSQSVTRLLYGNICEGVSFYTSCTLVSGIEKGSQPANKDYSDFLVRHAPVAKGWKAKDIIMNPTPEIGEYK